MQCIMPWMKTQHSAEGRTTHTVYQAAEGYTNASSSSSAWWNHPQLTAIFRCLRPWPLNVASSARVLLPGRQGRCMQGWTGPGLPPGERPRCQTAPAPPAAEPPASKQQGNHQVAYFTKGRTNATSSGSTCKQVQQQRPQPLVSS